MDIRSIETFVAVAEELHFGAAAARLHVVQSTVSASIRGLERELGASLFARSTRSVALTEAGASALPVGRELLAAADRMHEAVDETSSGLRGSIRFGTFAALVILDLPEILAGFRREAPHVDVRLSTSPSGSTGLAEDLRAGRLDIALVALPPEQLSGLETVTASEHRFVAILPVGHRLAARRAVSLRDLAAEPFVDTVRGFGNRVLLDAAFAARRISRTVAIEVADLAAIGGFVAAGFGVAVTPEGLAPIHPATVSLPLEGEPLTWRISVATRTRPSAATRRLFARFEERAGI
ncbi:LysR family transcriptional regulator [Naasia lichenicola]|uniref:LysR family transcriptional regulator n=1 Tax=Naasia lichenicola TaxID=2565933 RepID=A0A4V3WTK4_9MICO|nr:LysR family transcriptional regulator [Naasia lichenicola]THG32317.1 LysR family transcriptional regulator [Naasia lichenicola]